MAKFDYMGAKKAGYSDQEIAKYLTEQKKKGVDLFIDRNEFSQINRSSQPAPAQKQGFLSKASDLSEKTFGKAANFLFGSTGKAVGGLITSGIGSGEALIGKATGNQKLVEQGRRLNEMGTKQATVKNIAGTLLESTVSGFGEKTITKVGAKLSAPLIVRAEKLYQSALKPTSALLKKSPDVVKTGLKEGIRVSEGGLTKTKGIIESIGEDIGKVIDEGAGEGKTILKEKIVPYVDEMKDYLGNSLGGKELVKEVDDTIVKVLGELPDMIPVKQAQQLKQNTQRILSKYYGRFAPVEAEAKKQLTRGLGNEIAKQVPEIAALNARDSKLFGLEQALQQAVSRMGNREVINAFDILTTIGGAAVKPGSPVATGGAALLFKKILQSPALNSQRAILYNKLADHSAKLLKAGRYPAAIATAKLLQLLNDERD